MRGQTQQNKNVNILSVSNLTNNYKSSCVLLHLILKVFLEQTKTACYTGKHPAILTKACADVNQRVILDTLKVLVLQGTFICCLETHAFQSCELGNKNVHNIVKIF